MLDPSVRHVAFRLAALAGVAAACAQALASTPTAPFMQLARLESDSTAAQSRPRLLERLAFSHYCFPQGMSPEAMEEVLATWGGLPPAQFAPIDERFFTDSTVWTGDLSQGPSAQAARANLTYSFPNDGTTWGLSAISSTGPNNLNSRFTTLFGASNLDRGREYLRQALASWRRYAGLTYQEVADDNVAMNQTTARVSTRGDIRIGGLGFGTNSFLAYNAFPSAAFAGVGGGDMCINTSFFTANEFNNAANNYRYLRNTTAHEHGHGLGNIHSVPCNDTKLMEPFITVAFDAVQIDERRGAGRNYGDRFSGNNSAANARNFGNLTTPILTSVIERNLSTNGTAGPNNTDEDWFSFTLDSTQTITISAAATGGSYSNGQQSFNCSGSTSTINASSAGNLNIQLIAADGVTVLQTASSAAAGAIETLSAGSRPSGTYYVRVFDVGPNSNQTVQLYDLTVRVGSSTAPPTVIAGVNKRIAANTNCFFMGDINSAANEGSLSVPGGFAWDLDGDGSFEVTNNAQPNRQYPSNGVFNVTLRVTDSNGRSATDTITVTVFGATTQVTSVPPGTGDAGTIVPVTINGTNLKNLTAASMVSVSGTGVSVIGTPTPNALGTVVTGLSFNIAPGAAAGARNVVVSNADGTGTGVGVFTIQNAPPPLPGGFNLSSPNDGATLPDTGPTLSWTASSNALSYNVSVDDDADFSSPLYTTSTAGLSATVPVGLLNYKINYRWRVIAENVQGSTDSTPASRGFRTPPCLGDATYDKVVDFSDITAILNGYLGTFPIGQSGVGDSNADDVVNFADITATLENWSSTCP